MQGKVAISNMEMLAFASKLALIVPGETGATYLGGALTIWEWVWSVPLIDENGLVRPGAVPVNNQTGVGCCNGSSTKNQSAGGFLDKCTGDTGPGFTYNHGMFISSCGYLR